MVVLCRGAGHPPPFLLIIENPARRPVPSRGLRPLRPEPPDSPSLIGKSPFGLLLIQVSSILLPSGGSTPRRRFPGRRLGGCLGRNIFWRNRAPLDSAPPQKSNKDQPGQKTGAKNSPPAIPRRVSGHLHPPRERRGTATTGAMSGKSPARSLEIAGGRSQGPAPRYGSAGRPTPPARGSTHIPGESGQRKGPDRSREALRGDSCS